MTLWQIYSENYVLNFIAKSPKFYSRYYEKHFGLFFPGHNVYPDVSRFYLCPFTF